MTAAEIKGPAAGTVTEDGDTDGNENTAQTVGGQLTSTDVDGDDNVFTASEQTNDYGTLKIDAAGKWTFTLNNSADAVQSLKAGESKELSFTVASQDGTEQVIKITVNGANDAATISGPAAGTVTEDGASDSDDNTVEVVGGQLTSTDVDGDDNVFTASEQTNNYGTLKIDAAGKWSFTLNNSADAVQSLKAGESKELSFTVASQDGTEQVIKITINGANDAATISGPAAGTVTEDGNTDGNDNTAQTVGGQLTSKDVDGDAIDGDKVFTVSEQTNDYGTLKIDAAGKWSFTLNNSADAVQSLKAGARQQ